VSSIRSTSTELLRGLVLTPSVRQCDREQRHSAVPRLQWSHLYEVQNHENRFFIIGRVSLELIPHFSRIGVFRSRIWVFLHLFRANRMVRMRWQMVWAHAGRRRITPFFQLGFKWKSAGLHLNMWYESTSKRWKVKKRMLHCWVVDTLLVSRVRRSEGFFYQGLWACLHSFAC
jgi:hypothetical protein